MEDRPTARPELEEAISLILESGYIVSADSRRLVEKRLRELTAKPNIRKILGLPCRGYEALGSFAPFLRPSYKDAVICVAIGLSGWAAWTAADDIRDGRSGQSAPQSWDDLYVFSILRPMIDELIGSLALREACKERLIRIIGMMEYANADHCSMSIRKISSWKSMGTAVPLLALIMKAGAPDDDIDACEAYFYDLILARQLSDDALDWKEDSRIINETLVVAWMDRAFDERVKYKVAEEMLKGARRATRKARLISCFTDTIFLEELPRYYENMAMKILDKKPPSGSAAETII